MRYRFRYNNIGPLYADSPFGRRAGSGLLDGLLNTLWYVVAFVLQLVVWAVLLVAGLVYTLIWLIVLPFHLLLGRRSAPPP